MPTFTYDQAVLLSCITPNQSCPEELCIDYACASCPAHNGTQNYKECQFITPYEAGYTVGSHRVRADMRAQFPPEQYPELYI